MLAALCTLVPKGGAPGLLLVQPAAVPDPTTWIASAAACLARLAEAEPRLPLFVAIEPEALDRFHAHAPESRAKALIRGGTVNVLALDGPEIGRRLERAIPGAVADDSPPRSAGSRPMGRRTDSWTSSSRLPELTAAPAPERETEPEHDDRARSAAERFLFERLETLPQTAGLFTLNAPLDFAFGAGRAMEVDLAASELALAVEIDGYYHFRDADAYRRDRRKDFELQKRGFLVVRVLADDVVGRLEEVLDQVLARSCRTAQPSSSRRKPMNEPSAIDLVDQLVLARLLVAGEKGATISELKKALDPLLGHRFAGAALAERLAQALASLESAGLVHRTRKGKTERGTRTPEGERHALEFLGLDHLPPGLKWDPIKKAYLAARALGPAPSEGQDRQARQRRPGIQGRAAEDAVRPAARRLPDVRPGDRRPGVEAAGVRGRAGSEVQRQDREGGALAA